MVISNLIPNCTVTKKYITYYCLIFGPYLVGIRRKTARHKTNRVDTDRVEITYNYMRIHKSVTLVDDAIFINKAPFKSHFLEGFL